MQIKRLVRLLLATPLAIAFVLIIRVIKPIVCVRVGVLRSDRIGHFMLETELQLLEIENRIIKQPSRTLNIWYAPEPIANRYAYKMWKRVIRVWPNWFMVSVFRVNNFFPGSASHRIPNTTSTCLDVHNLLDESKPRLYFSEQEVANGESILRKMGIDGHSRFVCFIVRDSAYTKAVFPGKDMSYHDYRNCDVDDYVLGAEALADRGLFVLRMGSIVSKPLRSNHPRVIDYANSEFRSEFMDIFLGAHCLFCVSDGLGFYAIPAVFRKPNAYVNYSPFHMFYSSRACDLGIAKTVKHSESGKRLRLSEMGRNGVAQFSHTDQYQAAGLEVESNSPEEIRDLMLEMFDRLENQWSTRPGDEQRQEKFWKLFSEVIGEERNICHGEIRSRYGAQFLRDNQDWVQ